MTVTASGTAERIVQTWLKLKPDSAARHLDTTGEPYNSVTVVARELAECAAGGGSAQAFLDAIESMLIDNDAHYDRNLIIVGLIEDIQNALLHSHNDLSTWDPWLGTETRRAWRLIDDMWQKRITTDQFNRFVDDGIAP